MINNKKNTIDKDNKNKKSYFSLIKEYVYKFVNSTKVTSVGGVKLIKTKINDPIVKWVKKEILLSSNDKKQVIRNVNKGNITFLRIQEVAIENPDLKKYKFASYSYKFLVGLFSGICSIIPGLSGATVFSATNTWDMVNDSISSVTKLFSDKEKFISSIKFLMPLVLGMGIGYLAFAFFYEFLTSSLVINLIPSTEIALYIFFSLVTLFAVISVWKQNKLKITKARFIYFSIFFLAILSLGFVSLFTPVGSNWYDDISREIEWVVAFFLGSVMFSTMIIPGVSGSLMLLVLGMYDWCIEQVSTFNIAFIGFFILGGIFGIILTSKFLEYITKKHPENSFFSIMGTMSSSFFVVLMTAPWVLASSITASYTIPIAVILAILFIIGIRSLSRE